MMQGNRQTSFEGVPCLKSPSSSSLTLTPRATNRHQQGWDFCSPRSHLKSLGTGRSSRPKKGLPVSVFCFTTQGSRRKQSLSHTACWTLLQFWKHSTAGIDELERFIYSSIEYLLGSIGEVSKLNYSPLLFVGDILEWARIPCDFWGWKSWNLVPW